MYLKVKPLKQNLPWNCGPTALRIVLQSQFAFKLTQNDIDFLTGVTPDGSTEYNFMRALDSLGFKYEQTNDGKFSDLQTALQNGFLPIVHIVLSDGGGHFMVVSEITDEDIHLADPGTGKMVKYGIPFFLGVWKVEEKQTTTPWYMVITGIGKSKHGSILNHYQRIRKKLLQWRKGL